MVSKLDRRPLLIGARERRAVLAFMIGWSCFGSGIAGLDAQEPRADVNAPNAPQPQSLSTLDGAVIRTVAFHGNDNFKAKVLLQRTGLELGERYDPFLAEAGRRTILEVYRKIGYAFVEVTFDFNQEAAGELVYHITEGARVWIRSVSFEGNSVFSGRVLRKLVTSKPYKLWSVRVFYTKEMIDADAERLRHFYYGKGYLGYDVSYRVTFSDDHTEVRVTFVVSEGRPYYIEKIEYLGQERLTAEQLQNGMRVFEGQVYDRDDAEKEVRRMTRMYHEQGYVDALVTQRPIFSDRDDQRNVILRFTIQEGQQFRIGRVEISGNHLCQDKVIRRVMDEYDFTPGELFNADIAQSRGRSTLERFIRGATSAEEVIIHAVDPADGRTGQKDVNVDITEGMTGMIMPGVGISSDTGFNGSLVYQQRNFDIMDWPESLKEFFTMKSFRGAGQTLRMNLNPGTYRSTYSISFSDPYFLDRPISFDLTGQKNIRFLEAYDEDRLGGFVGFEHRKWGWLSPSFRLRAENYGIRDLDSDAPQEIRDVQGDNPLYGLQLGIGHRHGIDDPFMPTEGYNTRISYEQVTGSDTFGLLTGSITKYIPLYEDVLERRTVLASRIVGGTVIGQAPPFQRFYGGGMGTYGLRGFDYRGVSPRGVQVFDDGTRGVEKDPIGSDWILVGSTELIVPLIEEQFSWVTFMDAGTVETGIWRLAAGVGVQIIMPQLLGPVPMRFVYGVPLIHDEADETRRFNFSMASMF